MLFHGKFLCIGLGLVIRLFSWIQFHKLSMVPLSEFPCRVDTHLDARNLFDSNAISFFFVSRSFVLFSIK
jgi:hypothetical protein